MHITKNMLNDIHNNTICNSQKLETAQIPVNSTMDEQIVAYS